MQIQPFFLVLGLSTFVPSAWAQGAPRPGDLLFTEFAPAGGFASTCEWFEMANTSDGPLDMSTCQFCIGPDSKGAWDCDPFEVVGKTGTLIVPAVRDELQPALFARNSESCRVTGAQDCVGWADDMSTCLARPTMLYSGEFSNSRPQEACVLCGKGAGSCDAPPKGLTLVDRIAYDYEEGLDDLCDPDIEGSCALQTCFYGAEPTDEVIFPAWYVPAISGTTLYYVPDEYDFETKGLERTWYPAVGTPGQANSCIPYQWPESCGVIFTEVMASPAPYGGTEWIEITNVGPAVDLNYCTIRVSKLNFPDSGETGSPDGTWEEESSYVLSTSEPIAMETGESLILSVDDCLFVTDQGAYGVEPGGVCPRGERIVDLSALSASSDLRLTLECPHEGKGGTSLSNTVDEMTFNATGQDALDGVSLLLDPASGDAATLCTANDDTSNWCPASYSEQLIGDLSGTDYEDWVAQYMEDPSDPPYRNWGTPGAFGDEASCLTRSEFDKMDRLPCRCAAGQPVMGGLLLGLGALVAALRRRMKGS